MAQIEVTVGGIVQPELSLPAPSQINCQLTELSSWKNDMAVQVRIINKGYARMAIDKISPEPIKFTELSQTVAGEGGAFISVIGAYFTKDASLSLLTQSGNVLCLLTYKSIGELTCQTLPGVVAVETVVLKNNENQAIIACEATKCTYETSSALTGVVNSATHQGSVGQLQIFTLTGTNFEIGATEVFIADKKANTVTSTSNTEIVAEFAEGVGFVQNVKPVVVFESKNVASVDPSVSITINLENSQGEVVVTSVRGGKDYELVASGIGTDQSIGVRVCGYPCPRASEKETSNKLVCPLPELPSIYALQRDSGLVKSTNLEKLESVQYYSSNPESSSLVYDGVYETGFGDGANCYVGIKS